jgi:hypothetical protein
MALYLSQNKKPQGFNLFASKFKTGSKLKRFFLAANSNIKAGFPKVNAGTKEMPLLVREAVPENVIGVLTSGLILSCCP